nr:cysteine-rich receptor-like protein kinase [Tanacetum cinerariifolium]
MVQTNDALLRDLRAKLEVFDTKAENGGLEWQEIKECLAIMKRLEDMDHFIRQIIDGPLMVNEIISWATKNNEHLFLYKVDFEKAFDSLDWGFLDYIMKQMGFSHKWRKCIRGCLKSAYGSGLVNGSLTKEFKIQKVLRQGDPLLPFLFIIAVKALHVTIQEAKSKNIFVGAKDKNDDSIKDNTSANVENDNDRVPTKINDMERQIFKGKLVLVGYDGIPVKLVNTDAQVSVKHSSEVSFRIGIVSIGSSLRHVSYAKLVNGERIRKSVNFHTLLALVGSRVDVAILLDLVHVVHECFSNFVCRFILGKRVPFLVVENNINSTWSKYLFFW